MGRNGKAVSRLIPAPPAEFCGDTFELVDLPHPAARHAIAEELLSAEVEPVVASQDALVAVLGKLRRGIAAGVSGLTNARCPQCTGLLVAPMACPSCESIFSITCVIRMGDEQRKPIVSCPVPVCSKTCGAKLATAKKVVATVTSWKFPTSQAASSRPTLSYVAATGS